MGSVVQTMKQDLRDFTTLSPQVRFLLVIQLVILFTLSVLVGVIFSPKFKQSVTDQQGNVIQPESETVEQVQYKVSPENEFLQPGEEIVYSVLSSGASPFATDIVLTYDPEVLEVSNVVNGDIFDRVIINEVQDGRILFSAAHTPGAAAELKKEGIVMKFNVVARAKTEETHISFIRDETIAAQNGENILGLVVGATMHIYD